MTDVGPLDRFAAGRVRRDRSFWSTLPDDVRDECVASDAPTSVVVDWLIAKGYTGATFGKVDPFLRPARRHRDRPA